MAREGGGRRRRKKGPELPWPRRAKNDASAEQPQRDDHTLQLKLPEPQEPDATMQLRAVQPAVSSQRAARRTSAPPSALARVTGRLAPYARKVAPYARKLRPVYPRPGRIGWRRWMPSWRQWLGVVLTSVGLSSAFLVVAYAMTDIPENLNSYATQQDNVYFWSDGTPMARTGWVQRQAMPLKNIPQQVR